MADQHSVDITHRAPPAEQFPLRLMQLGFRLMQVVDTAGHAGDLYILPPVRDVPSGPFLMGSKPQTWRIGPFLIKRRSKGTRKDTTDEWPQHTVTLSAYQIGTYPLTVAEYACAVRAHAVGEARIDTEDEGHGVDSWQPQLTHPDHPVENIEWSQAVAYTQWLARVTGEPWRLPTEAEWEKAARGTDGRTYPWGNRPLKVARRTKRWIGTAPVGSYPQSASPYGVQEMAVNLLEWCSSQYRPYPYRADDGREEMQEDATLRAVRGGGRLWYGGIWQSRAAYRVSLNPYLVDDLLSTRLVRAEPAG